ncbi:hypothetical protein BDK51DRAFT_32386, partial [Blyttiomyces helicus]
DVEAFADRHPGGPGLINSLIGEDATNFFQGEFEQHAHSRLALAMMKDLSIGRLNRPKFKTHTDANESAQTIRSNIHRSHDMLFIDDEEIDQTLTRQAAALDPYEFRSLPILMRDILTEDSVIHPVWKFRLGFERPTDLLVAYPGDCILLTFTNVRGESVVREYTPIQSVNTGYMDLIVKMIGGPMTSHLLKTPTIAARGLQRRMMCLNPRSTNGCWNKVGMIAGGTGITPMLLMIDYHMRNAPRTSTGHLAVELSLLHVFPTEDECFEIELLDALEDEARGALKNRRRAQDHRRYHRLHDALPAFIGDKIIPSRKAKKSRKAGERKEPFV